MNPVFSSDGASRVTCGRVRFTPGARTNWTPNADENSYDATELTPQARRR